MKNTLYIFIITLVFSSCSGNKKTPDKEVNKQIKPTREQTDELWKVAQSSVVVLESYDGDRILEKGMGFFVAEDLIVTRLSLVNQATKVNFKPLDEQKFYSTSQYTTLDRINDLILLKTDQVKKAPIALSTGLAPQSAKSIYISPHPNKTIQLFTGKVLNLTTANGNKLYRISNRIRKSNCGMPLFLSDRKAYGLGFATTINYQMQSFATPSGYIADLLKKTGQKPLKLETLRAVSEEQAAENKKIKGLLLETDAGDIQIRLFNETPAYRDNFIKLAKEGYFDSLLIHRVIPDFGIQSGAADTRYAEKGDNVGWKGPGYTLPAHIVPSLFHQRGRIGSPRKPDTANRRRRSDGSQFYIVSGRKYFDKELDELEKQNNYTFSPQQREVYKTIGGAPHLDGTYTVFGEVTAGMDVVDRIAKVETDKRWRPLNDIRIQKVRIIK